MSRSERTWDLERQDKARGLLHYQRSFLRGVSPNWGGGGCFLPLHSLPALLPKYLPNHPACHVCFACHVLHKSRPRLTAGMALCVTSKRFALEPQSDPVLLYYTCTAREITPVRRRFCSWSGYGSRNTFPIPWGASRNNPMPLHQVGCAHACTHSKINRWRWRCRCRCDSPLAVCTALHCTALHCTVTCSSPT